jgi:hypothetical protein
MSIDYNNTVELVDILYKFVYDQENSNQYTYVVLKPEKINLNTIIKDKNFEYQYILNSSLAKKDNFKIMSIIENNFDNLQNDLKYKKIVLKKYFKNFPLTLVIQKYLTKYEETINIVDIYYELFINQIISEYIINDKIPFFLLNICNFNVELDKLSVNKDFFNLIIEEYKIYNISSKSKFCISLYEHYHSYDTLPNLLKTELTENDIKNIFFQIFFTYAYLNYKLVNFRHNYFIIDSFLIQKIQNNITYYLNLGDLSFKLENPRFICKLFNYRFSSIDGYKNVYETDISNSTYDIYFFFISILNYPEINKNNLEKIKIIISNFISYDLINSPLIDEIKFKTKYTFSIIPIHILSKNNFFINFINMNSKSKEFNKKYSKKTKELDTVDEYGLDDGIDNAISLKKTSKKKSTKKKSLKRAINNDKKINRYLTKMSVDYENQSDDLVNGDSDLNKTPESGYKIKSKSKKKLNKKKLNKKKVNYKKEESSISSLSLEEDKLFNQPLKNKNNNMSNLLKNIKSNQLIPVIGEIQNTMDINQYQNNQVYSSDNEQTKIMDKGIYNLINSGKLSMPYINSGMNMMSQYDQHNNPQMMPNMNMQQMMPDMNMQQMMPPQMSMPQMMSPQMSMPQLSMPSSFFNADEGIKKLEMPLVDTSKDDLLTEINPPSLNTNIDTLVGGSINDFFLKKKIKKI